MVPAVSGNTKQQRFQMNESSFKESLELEFSRVLSRINYRRRSFSEPINLSILFDEDDFCIWVMFSDNENVTQQLCIPKIRKDAFGNDTIGNRQVQRALCSWYLVEKKTEMNYWEVIYCILAESVKDFLPGSGEHGNRATLVERIIRSFHTRVAPIVVRGAQRTIDSLVNSLPLVGSPMQTWAMNNRVMFIDPIFDALTPQEVLEYHKNNNVKMFPWTSIGLSDSSIVKNYMLKVDLRKYSPFCVKHHSPMRNLYQPLGMLGEEKPLISTESMQALEDSGISRDGWNWMTAFVDLPMNFEDQIMVHHKHQDKVHSSVKKFMAFGNVLVKEGDQISNGMVLSSEPGDQAVIFNCHCEAAYVTSIEKSATAVNGNRMDVSIITVEVKRRFKDGVKFTNLHGNKGVAVFCDTGMLHDPIRNKSVDIDVIVAAKTVENRKNFGQIFEALATMIGGNEKRVVIPDDYFCDVQKVKQAAVKAGLREDCTCDIQTRWGSLKAVCGWLFWGLLKEPEDALWEKKDVMRMDQVGIRTSGIKMSHIEFRGLTTLFGPKSGVVQEVLSYQEGVDVVRELIFIVESMRGTVHSGKRTIPWDKIKPVDQSKTFLHKRQELLGTLSDQFYKDGFYMALPATYRTYVPRDRRKSIIEMIGSPTVQDISEYTCYETNTIYVPFADIRESWRHQCGLLGLSDITAMLNNVVLACRDFNDSGDKNRLENALRSYFHGVSKKLSTKSGLISQRCLSVRYPNSVKATATQLNSLPKNTIEIHEDMARDLRVRHGDFVLVERFPCLGFMSVRVQKVFVTNDSNCKYVVRVSKGSLNSTNLDFDGDTLFISSFHTPEAKAELEYEFRFPNKETEIYIEEAYKSKQPRVAEASIESFCSKSLRNGQPPMTFAELTPEVQAEIVGMLAGIKLGTGTVVALGYNLSRILEGEISYEDSKINAQTEVILDRVANSVFGSKHKVTALLEKMHKEGV